MKELIRMAKFQDPGSFFFGDACTVGAKIFKNLDRERVEKWLHEICRAVCGGFRDVAFGCTSGV